MEMMMMMMMMRLEELECGVVKIMTFKPTYEELLGHYLYNEIMIGPFRNGKKHVFPELDLYGESGMQPWLLWDYLEGIRFPHQEFSYFFAILKTLSSKGKGKRCFRRVGSGETMGTWSETETSKPVYVCGVAFGRIKKFRYENTKSEHHAAWIMEEFSFDHPDVPSSDLVLCRIKRNEKGSYSSQRKQSAIERGNEANAKMQRCFVEAEQQYHEMLLSVDDFLCGLNVAGHQSGIEQGCSTSTNSQQQLEFGNNVDVGDDVIVSQNEDAGFEKDGTTCWLDNAEMPRCSVEAEQTEMLSADDFFCGQNVADHQAGLEQGCSYKDVSASDGVIVSQIEDTRFQEEGTSWLDDYALEEEPLDTSSFGNHIAAGGDVQTIISSHSREEEEGTNHNVSTSQVVPPSFSSDQVTSTSPSTSSQQPQDMSPISAVDDQAFGFAYDNDILSADAAFCFQIEDFGFGFEDEFFT